MESIIHLHCIRQAAYRRGGNAAAAVSISSFSIERLSENFLQFLLKVRLLCTTTILLYCSIVNAGKWKTWSVPSTLSSSSAGNTVAELRIGRKMAIIASAY